MSECVRLPVSSGWMSRGILIFATANKSQRLQAKNWSARIWKIRKRSGDARYAAFEKRGRYRTCSARATSSRRKFFRQRHSIPELPMPRAFEGGYTDIFFTGVARNVWHCDIASLYPSVMLQFECFPATDQLQIFRHLLTDVRTFRLEAKAKMRAEQDPAKQHHLQALQNTFKILLNSFYGYLGFAQGHFADFDAAARVTQIGRDLLKKMIEWLNAHGAHVVEVDTDGIYFLPPSSASSVEAGVSPARSKI